jgi:hypothetical protein
MIVCDGCDEETENFFRQGKKRYCFRCAEEVIWAIPGL